MAKSSKTQRRLEGRVAIITGSSSGIGQAIAIEMAREGAAVVVNYHSSKDGALETLRAVKEAKGRGVMVQADVSKEKDVLKLIAKAVSSYGRLDIMVCNTGIQLDAPFLEMDTDKWNGVIATNLTGQFLCAREAARQFMKQTRPGPADERYVGNIICMSSVHDVIPWAGHVNYAASKGGVLLFMKSIAQELAPQGIRVNAISPGAIRTPINQAVWSDPEKYKELLKLIPYRRIGTPEDIGKAAVWLASDDSDYVVGETLYIDGGMTLYPEFADNG